MLYIFVCALLAAQPLQSHGQSSCKDLPQSEPRDSPLQGMRMVDMEKCRTCQGAEECYGCLNAPQDTCARCVYDMVTCMASRPGPDGKTMCEGLLKGQTARDHADCGGPSLPYWPPKDYPLCPQDTIPELDYPPMFINDAKNLCAWHRLKSNASAFCIGFEWKPPQTLSAPQDACPAGVRYDDGIMWRTAPKCKGCETTHTCNGCRNGTYEACEECVFDKDKCYNGPGKAVCDRLIDGVKSRGEPACGEPPHPHPSWPKEKVKVTFKSAFKPDFKRNGCKPGALRVSSEETAVGSAKRKWLPVPYHTVQQTDGQSKDPENMRDIFFNLDQGSFPKAQAWSYDTAAFPPPGDIHAKMSNIKNLIPAPTSNAFVLTSPPPDGGKAQEDAQSSIVV